MKTVEIVSPESVGMNSVGLENVKNNIQQDIDKGITNGGVVLVARKGKICFLESIGTSDIEENRPAKFDDVFFLMSLTKSITAVAILKAIEQGKFEFDTKVSSIFPEFAANGKQSITIRQLLTHQVNLWGTWNPIPGLTSELTDMEAVAKAAAVLPPTSNVNEQYTYQPMVTYSVLGYLLVLVDEKQRSYTQIIQEEIFEPLGMTDSSIGRDPSDARVVPTVFCYGPTKNQKKAIFLNDFYKGEVPGVNGYGTAFDIFKFGEMLRLGGSYNGSKILSPAMLKYAMNIFTGNQENIAVQMEYYRLGIDYDTLPANYTLVGGYMRGEGHIITPIGKLASPYSYAGLGGGSTMMMFDPERELTFVYLGHGHTLGLDHMLRMQKLSDLILGCIDIV